MCHGNSLYILLLIIFAPLFIFLFIRLVSVQSCIPRRAALDQLRGIFDIIQAGRSFIQVNLSFMSILRMMMSQASLPFSATK